MSYIYGMPLLYSKMTKPTESEIYSTYWKFAAERQNIFFNKIIGTRPLTRDKILKTYKFTNAYRASDRVSQYLIKEVIYSDEFSAQNIFFRIMLFKLFNKIETWKFLEMMCGSLVWETYSFSGYSDHLSTLISLKKPIYSGAYIMASGKSAFGYKMKFQNHLRLLEFMMKDDAPSRIIDANSLSEVYNILKGYPTLGTFLAFQLTMDLNYSTLINFSEMEYVVAGPGAKDGINKCFTSKGDFSDEDIIKLITEKQKEEFEKRGIDFKNLWGRSLHLVDCQNLFCEVDKYSRMAHPEISGSSKRVRIKQLYKQSEVPINNYFFPPKWGLNDKINHNYG